jgi:hypothetical protein
VPSGTEVYLALEHGGPSQSIKCARLNIPNGLLNDELETRFAMIDSSLADLFKRPSAFVTNPGKFVQFVHLQGSRNPRSR